MSRPGQGGATRATEASSSYGQSPDAGAGRPWRCAAGGMQAAALALQPGARCKGCNDAAVPTWARWPFAPAGGVEGA